MHFIPGYCPGFLFYYGQGNEFIPPILSKTRVSVFIKVATNKHIRTAICRNIKKIKNENAYNYQKKHLLFCCSSFVFTKFFCLPKRAGAHADLTSGNCSGACCFLSI